MLLSAFSPLLRKADRTLDDIGVDLDAPVIEEARQTVPAR
jgi:hypothetical protein